VEKIRSSFTLKQVRYKTALPIEPPERRRDVRAARPKGKAVGRARSG
jgi:hypothetical protein